MSRELDSIGDAVVDALEKHPPSDVLAIVTGVFVGLTVELCRRQGEDVTKQININGCGSRNVTIHPPEQEGGAA